MALSRQALPYRWDWDNEKAWGAFEARYPLKRQTQIRKKLDEFCRHAKGDVDRIEGHPGYFRLKLPPDRVIFYVGEKSKTVWVVSVAPRGKGTYDL